MTTCMGGWCHLRDKCKHHAPNPHQTAVERLCEAGDDDAYEPLIVTRAVGTWERSARALPPGVWFGAIEA